jgi:hypothetical protein
MLDEANGKTFVLFDRSHGDAGGALYVFFHVQTH